jgi:hypothetical protein
VILTRIGDVTTLLLEIRVFWDTTLITNAIRPFETSGTSGPAARCHTSEDSNSQIYGTSREVKVKVILSLRKP